MNDLTYGFSGLTHPVRENAPRARGQGGGGKGGGGGGLGKDTIKTSHVIRLVEAICEGPVKAISDPYFNDTPYLAPDGSANFKGVRFEKRLGLPSQAPIPGLSSQEAETMVDAVVEAAVPVVRQISDPNTDSVKVQIKIPALFDVDTDDGGMDRTSVSFRIQYMPAGGQNWIDIQNSPFTINERITSPAFFNYRFPLTGAAPWQVRVQRVTADSPNPAEIANEIYFFSYTECIDQQFSYPNTALVGMEVAAEQFGSSVPARGYLVDGLICKVPTNFNPDTRTYSGVWNGTWKDAWTDCPAWCTRELVRNPRWGLGQYIPMTYLDDTTLYAISQYAAQKVDDGAGNMEPRFSFNAYINNRNDAYQLLNSMVSVFRGMIYYALGSIHFTADGPGDPVLTVTRANTINGDFTYKGASLLAQHNRINVTFNNPADNYRRDVVTVEDPDAIAKYGLRVADIVAFGCTSRAQAMRVGRWLLYTERMESEVLTYVGGPDHFSLRPGERVRVMDPSQMGRSMGGRLVAAGAGTVTLDREVTLEVGVPYELVLTDRDRALHYRTVTSAPGARTAITFSGGLPPLPDNPKEAIWALRKTVGPDTLWRVISNREVGPQQYEISALRYEPGKFALVESGLDIPDFPEPLLPTGPLGKPTNLRARPYSRPNPGSANIPGVSISFTAPSDPRVRGFELEYQERDRGVQSIDLRMESGIELDNLNINRYEFRARSYDGTGRYSEWTDSTFTNVTDAPDRMVVPAITDFVLWPGFRAIVAQWSLPEGITNFKAVHLNGGPTANFADSNKLATTTTDRHMIGGLGSQQTLHLWARVEVHASRPTFSAWTYMGSATTEKLVEFDLDQSIIDAIDAASGSAAGDVAAAEAARDAAIAAAQNAAAAQALASNAAADASEALGAAEDAAGNASTAQGLAEGAAESAAQALSAAQGASTLAGQAAGQAGASASEAAASLTAAQGAQAASVAAQAAAEAAQQGAQGALTAAQGASTAASASQVAAEAAQADAIAKAAEAVNAAGAAAGHATTASSAADAAGNSASAASASATAASTSAGQASASQTAAASSATTAEGHSLSASQSSMTAVSTAARVFPSEIGDGRFWTHQSTGTPEAVASISTNTALNLDAAAGTITVNPGTATTVVRSRQAVPAVIGRVYRISAEVMGVGGIPAAARIQAHRTLLTQDFATQTGLQVASLSITAPDVWQTISAIHTMPATLSPLHVWARFGIVINNSAGDTVPVKVRKILIEDITDAINNLTQLFPAEIGDGRFWTSNNTTSPQFGTSIANSAPYIMSPEGTVTILGADTAARYIYSRGAINIDGSMRTYRVTAEVRAKGGIPVANRVRAVYHRRSETFGGGALSPFGDLTPTAADTWQMFSATFGPQNGSGSFWTRLGIVVYSLAGDMTDIEVRLIKIEDISESTASATSASNAAASETAAGQSASAAQISATNAGTSAGAASTHAGQASQSAQDADGHRAQAAVSAGAAATSRDEAGGFATAASGHAQTASTKATEAGTHASAAQTARTGAETARGQAQTFATQASDAKDTAEGHASNASTSAGAAAGSATAAGQSATAAASSAQTASTKATEAGQSATAAAGSATAADTARGQASTFAGQASQSATNAAGSATEASTSAGAAAGSATLSGQRADAASQSAQTASTKATEAEQSATASATARTGAETARGQAQTAATNAATSETNAAGSASAASTSQTVTANTLTAAQRALANSAAILTAIPTASLAAFGATVTGTPDTFAPFADSAYGSDTAGSYVQRVATASNNGAFLRALVPSVLGNVYRVTAKIKASHAMSLRLQANWISPTGTSLASGNYVTTAFAAGEVKTLTMIFGRTAGGLVTQTGGTDANWNAAMGLRFGVSVTTGVAASNFQVYEIRVDDLTQADAAARSATLASGSASAAASSASNASASETAAGQSATAAAGSATAADTARGQASTFAGQASQSVTDAAGSASQAAASAGAAAGSATTAGQHAGAASTSAQTASTKATEAGQSATASDTAKTGAETARTAAQTAATNAASAQTGAENAASAASSNEVSARSSAAASLPAPIGDGRFFTDALIGTPEAARPLSQAAPITVADGVATIPSSAGTKSILTRGSLPYAAARKYRVTAEVMAPTTLPANNQIRGFINRLSPNWGAHTSAAFGDLKPSAVGEWQTVSAIFTAAAVTDRSQVRGGVQVVSAAPDVQIRNVLFEDVTDSEAAKASATAAAGSASTASTKATEASQSASAASTSETNAGTSAGAANTSAGEASQARQDADGHRAQAALSATAAAGSANAAGQSATAASTSAGTAATKATEAGQSATAANTAKTNAETAATNAGTSATQAATARQGAENAASAASASQVAAESSVMLTLPAPIGDGRFHTAAASGSPTSVSSLGAVQYVTMDPSGYVEIAGAQTWNIGIRTKGVFPYIAGRTYRVTAEIMAVGGLLGTNRVRALLTRMDADYGAPNHHLWNSLNPTAADTWQTVSAEITPTGLADKTWARLGIQIQNISGDTRNVRIKSILVEDITDADAAAKSATAAAESASTANTKASDAGTYADSALSHRNDANTYRGQASVSQIAAAASATDAATSSSQAYQASQLAARLMSGGVSPNPVFNEWAADGTPVGYQAFTQGGTITRTAAAWQNKYGQAVQLDTGDNPTQNGPILRLVANDYPNYASNNPNAVYVTAELFRSTGNARGGIVRAVWQGTNAVAVNYFLWNKLVWRNNTMVQFVAERPADFIPGSSPTFYVEVIAGSDVDGARERNVVVVHRLDYQEVQNDASVVQWQRAKVSVENIASAAYGLRVKAGGASAGFEMVALGDPLGGGASAIRMAADEILMDGTVKGSKMAMEEILTNHLQLRGQVVTVPASAQANTDIVVNHGAWANICQLTIAREAGFTTELMGYVMFRPTVNGLPVGTIVGCHMAIFRGGTMLQQFTHFHEQPQFYEEFPVQVGPFEDTNTAAGNTNYSIRVMNYPGLSNTLTARTRYIKARQFKR